MKVSAVGFLFQDSLKGTGLKGKNYTCIIHKENEDGNYNRNVISSPIIKKSTIDVVTPDVAQTDILDSLKSITDKKSDSKFIGATIKDGVKETEIHSFLADKLFAVRTKDENGKNHFQILGKDNTQKVLAKNLYLMA